MRCRVLPHEWLCLGGRRTLGRLERARGLATCCFLTLAWLACGHVRASQATLLRAVL